MSSSEILSEILFVFVFPISITFLGLIFSLRTEFIRDSVIENKDYKIIPYSFARTQLLWWSLIIISCLSIKFGKENISSNQMNISCVILMGISLGTVSAAKIIDNTDKSQNLYRHQESKSIGFLTDILSDENGISVSRFQAFAFNLIFGLIFIYYFFTTNQLYEFNDLQLSLMGISSSAYVGLKINENMIKKEQTKSQQGESPESASAT